MSRSSRRGRIGPLTTVLIALALAPVSCGDGSDDEAALDGGERSNAADAAVGEDLYAETCAACHGADLRGTDRGPSHLSVVYEPGHHSDDSMRSAVASGSPQHHWEFGDMPPVTGLDEDQVDAIIAYIREVQERDGFEPYPPQ
jgi:mono/diheme cytochrome c family protein